MIRMEMAKHVAMLSLGKMALSATAMPVTTIPSTTNARTIMLAAALWRVLVHHSSFIHHIDRDEYITRLSSQRGSVPWLI